MKRSLFQRSFWIAILLMAAAVIGLSVLAMLRDHPVVSRNPPPVAPQTREIPESQLGQMIRKAGDAAFQAQEQRVDGLLAAAYGPVYTAIPAYADFHYSVLGEYSELGTAALGRMSEGMEARLFPELAPALVKVAQDLDRGFMDNFRASLDRQVGEELAGSGASVGPGEVTRHIQRDAIARIGVTAPVAVTMTLAAQPAVKAAAGLMAKKLATKIAGKAAAKGAVKATGVGSGAAGGAAICSPGGPVASILCGAGAAAVIWFGTDAAIVNLDEYFNREEFEAELHAMIDDNRAEARRHLLGALETRRVATEDFTFRRAAEDAGQEAAGSVPRDGGN